jgi:glycosyltransferase involved in cell wall biosynthesis
VRVLVVASWPPWPLDDGSRLVLHHHLRVLAPRHAITVLAGCRHGDEAPPAGSVPANVDFHWFGQKGTGLSKYSQRRWRSLVTGRPADVFRVEVDELVHAYERALAEERPDVVHLMGAETAFLAARAKAAGIPVVHMAIDAWRESFGKHQLIPRWRRLIERGQRRKVMRFEERYLGACDAVVIVAERDAGALRDAVPGLRVVVVANGVEAGPEPDVGTHRQPVLGIHGTMATLPNRTAAVALANDILPLVQASVPEARARIIGRDPAPDVLRLQRDDVEVTGAVTELSAELARLAVYVVPMTEGSGIKNKVLEAMAAGLPVVGSRRALDGIGEGPGVVAHDDPAALAAAVVDFLLDPDAARRCGLEGRRRVVEEFPWERSAEAIERLWRELAGVSETS